MTTGTPGAPFQELVEQYASVLRAYVQAPSEALRDRAYQLGHQAIARGLGVLDITAIHREVLLELLGRAHSPQESVQVARRASELLIEGLVPFEMTHRGYKETIHKLIAANEALRSSEAKNLALLNAIPDVMFRVGRDGTFLDFKAGKDAAAPIPPGEVVGRQAPALLPAGLAEQLMDSVERALQSTTIQVFEYQFEVNGLRHDYEVRLAVSGKDEVLGILRDVTERKRAEEEHAKLIRAQAARAEAQAAQERISNILESIADGFVALDSQWRFTYVNRQAERLLRVRREDVLCRSMWEVFPESVGSRFYEEYHRAVAERVTAHLRAFYPPLRTWFEAHAYPSKEGLSVYFRDVTEQRHRERARLGLARIAQQIAATTDVDQALAMAVGELVSSFDIALAGIWLWDEAEQALVLRASAGLSARHAASRLSRLRVGESEIGQIAASRRPLWSNALRREASPLPPGHGKPAGPDAFAGFPLLVGDQLLGVMGLFSRRPFDEDDLTALATLADHLSVAIEKARLLAEVQAALKLREEFIDAAAHELRTPVTVLKGYASLLRRNPDPGSATFAKALKALETSADRVARLARELVDADALERGTMALLPRRIDLAELAREVAGAAAAEHPNYRFDLRTMSGPVVADRERIGEVIRHLIDNAVKYQPWGGEIDVAVVVAAGEAVVTVQDHGLGIPQERHHHMFEPMYEPIPAGRTGYVGVVGLGLMLSKRLVELHGGRIWFESKPGQGSSFHFALRLALSRNGETRATEQGG